LTLDNTEYPFSECPRLSEFSEGVSISSSPEKIEDVPAVVEICCIIILASPSFDSDLFS
jgi:hypothetical protein